MGAKREAAREGAGRRERPVTTKVKVEARAPQLARLASPGVSVPCLLYLQLARRPERRESDVAVPLQLPLVVRCANSRGLEFN